MKSSTIFFSWDSSILFGLIVSQTISKIFLGIFGIFRIYIFHRFKYLSRLFLDLFFNPEYIFWVIKIFSIFFLDWIQLVSLHRVSDSLISQLGRNWVFSISTFFSLILPYRHRRFWRLAPSLWNTNSISVPLSHHSLPRPSAGGCWLSDSPTPPPARWIHNFRKLHRDMPRPHH